ncbi:head-tail connector protein [Alsobacter sp. KACC 23698]|uniref:Head-tail connector protein n=1 Tax=Alsobacter sp. KACC 23698 TaxID=3149229 RepID=A0AAU7JIH2_9HYPH
MALQILTPPATEPLTLAELKLWLRIDGADDDALLSALIVAARLAVEAASGCKLITQTWRMTLNAWPRSPFGLPVWPVQAVTAVRVYAASGAATTVSPDLYQLATAFLPPQLALAGAAPAPGRSLGGVEIDLTAGYGPTAAAVLEALRTAIRLFAAHLYENRGDGEPGAGPVPPPPAVAALVAPYRRARL